MTMTKQQLVAIVDLCWSAACEARLHGVPSVLFQNTLTHPDGTTTPNVVVDTLRVSTYFSLLSAMLPKNFSSSVEIQEPKEPWES